MVVFLTDGDAVIAVPCVEDCPLFAVWDGSHLVERGGCVMRLPFCVSIEGLEVDGPTWFAVFLCAEHHSVAPCDGFAYGYRLDDTQTDVLIKACLDLLLPMK